MNGARAGWWKRWSARACDTLFGYPGGAIMPVYDALHGAASARALKHILVRHEQGAALAADAYGRATGRVGVCLATSGPGATNLVTGIANAFLDSVPMVAITGQVATSLMGTDAFQEVDIFGMTLPIVKHSFLSAQRRRHAADVREAFRIARSGRPGPVLIDLPKDVQNGDASHLPAHVPAPVDAVPEAPRHALHAAAALIAQAQKPCSTAAAASRSAMRSTRSATSSSRRASPRSLTLKGLGALPADASADPRHARHARHAAPPTSRSRSATC